MAKKLKALHYPVISLGAEHLVIGSLMRRNVLAYKAPPNNRGYDLICIRPEPNLEGRQIKVQVKSRYATDSDRSLPVKAHSFDCFDYLVAVFMNVGNFQGKKDTSETDNVEFYTLPMDWVRRRHYRCKSGFDKIKLKGLDLSEYRDRRGFDLIATELGIGYPTPAE